MRANPTILLFSLTLLLTPSWAAKHSFKVDAINNPDVEIEHGTSFKIVSDDARIREDDLQFQKVSHYVKTILSGKGYYEAPDRKSADLIVDVTYGTKNPHVEFDVRHSQVPSARTAGIWDPTGRNRYPQGGPFGAPGRITIGGRDRDGRYTRIVTAEDEITPKTVYDKYLKITARENQPNQHDELFGNKKGQVEAWSVTVINEDESDDLDKYLPMLAAAAISYVGKKTESQEVVKFKENDELVRYVKRGL